MSKPKASGGAGALPSTPRVAAPAAAAAPIVGERTFFVQKDGDPGWAEVAVASNLSVARLLKEAVKELGLTERLTTLGLYPTGKDGKIKHGQEPLDNTEALVKALPDATSDSKHFFVIKEVTATERKYTCACLFSSIAMVSRLALCSPHRLS